MCNKLQSNQDLKKLSICIDLYIYIYIGYETKECLSIMMSIKKNHKHLEVNSIFWVLYKSTIMYSICNILYFVHETLHIHESS